MNQESEQDSVSAVTEAAEDERVSPPAFDALHFLNQKRRKLARMALVRLGICGALWASLIPLEMMDAPNELWVMLPGLLGFMSLIWFGIFLGRSGINVIRCRRVVKHYSPSFRAFARRKDGEYGKWGHIFTFVLAEEGEPRKSVRMRGVEMQGGTSWPDAAENGVWMAGDSAFRGVVMVPEDGATLLVKPAEWETHAQERKQADPERLATAKRANLDERWLGGVNAL